MRVTSRKKAQSAAGWCVYKAEIGCSCHGRRHTVYMDIPPGYRPSEAEFFICGEKRTADLTFAGLIDKPGTFRPPTAPAYYMIGHEPESRWRRLWRRLRGWWPA